MISGAFRKKDGFTIVQNTLAKDSSISMKAKGLYLVIRAHITDPNKVYTKKDFVGMVAEGDKAFENAWNELKNAGFLKTHFYANHGKFIAEYDLLTEPEAGPHTFWYDNNGDLVRTNLGVINEQESEQVDEEENEETRIPQKGVSGSEDTRTPLLGSTGNGINGKGADANIDINNNINIYNKTNYKTNNKNLSEGEREQLNPVICLSPNIRLDEETENRLYERFMESSHISEELAYKPEAMKEVIMYLADWNELISYDNALYREVYRLTIENIIELATMLDAKEIKERMVSFKSVILYLNDIINDPISDSERKLEFFVSLVVEKYMEILKTTSVTNQKKYLKSVIVDSFGTYKAEWEAKIQKSSYEPIIPKKKVNDFSWLED